MLDESGYTGMWQKDRSPAAPGRLENLKELVGALGEFEDLASFLDHVSLVMDREGDESEPMVNIMTLHGAKGLEFDTVFLPGWEEGSLPPPARARRSRLRRPGGGAAPRLCRPHPRQAAVRPCPHRGEPIPARPVGERDPLALHGRACAGPAWSAPSRWSRDSARARRALSAATAAAADPSQRRLMAASMHGVSPRRRTPPVDRGCAGATRRRCSRPGAMRPATASSTRSSATGASARWTATSWRSPSTRPARRRSSTASFSPPTASESRLSPAGGRWCRWCCSLARFRRSARCRRSPARCRRPPPRPRCNRSP